VKRRLKRVLGETILWRSLLALRWNIIPSIKRPIQRYVIMAADYWFDARFGTDTARQVPADELQGVGDNRLHAGKYQASVPGHFRRLMTAVPAPPQSVFVDFGCGKGRALMLAAEHGFRRVVGVEFAHDLCAVAARNLEGYTRRRRFQPVRRSDRATGARRYRRIVAESPAPGVADPVRGGLPRTPSSTPTEAGTVSCSPESGGGKTAGQVPVSLTMPSDSVG
jgi:hypothetical protein